MNIVSDKLSVTGLIAEIAITRKTNNNFIISTEYSTRNLYVPSPLTTGDLDAEEDYLGYFCFDYYGVSLENIILETDITYKFRICCPANNIISKEASINSFEFEELLPGDKSAFIALLESREIVSPNSIIFGKKVSFWRQTASVLGTKRLFALKDKIYKDPILVESLSDSVRNRLADGICVVCIGTIVNKWMQ